MRRCNFFNMVKDVMLCYLTSFLLKTWPTVTQLCWQLVDSTCNRPFQSAVQYPAAKILIALSCYFVPIASRSNTAFLSTCCFMFFGQSSAQATRQYQGHYLNRISEINRVQRFTAYPIAKIFEEIYIFTVRVVGDSSRADAFFKLKDNQPAWNRL